MRFQLKTQFDKNVVTHYQNQEQIFDYIFTRLGINADACVPHPVVLTECYVNPNYCRQLMSELLFECYDVPSVCYGVDSIYSFQHNQIGVNGLIISCGYHTTHIIPVLNNVQIASKARRINLGGFHMINFLHRLLQLKYPVHVNAITISRIEELLHNYCSISFDYMADLKKWAFLEFYEENVKKIQLPYNTPATSTSTLTAEQKIEKKKELARRLTEINARKREERLADDEDQLQRMLAIRELLEEGEIDEFNATLKENDIANVEELDKLLSNVKSRIERTRQKMTANESTSTAIIEEKIAPAPLPPADMSVEEWVNQIKLNRNAIIERKQSRRQRRQDLAKRRTAAAQERMRIISQLARKEKGSDNFGMRDEDWDIYKAISKENGDSDSEMENEKLIEYEDILRHHDPMFEEPAVVVSGAAESHQLHVGVEAIRAPELLFQPSMIGSSEAGLAETIDFIFKMFTAEEQLLLATNVFLTGGCARFPGLKERLSKELLEMRPFQTPHKVYMADSPSLDAWFGARDFANSSNLPDYLVTKSEYLEKGGEYLKEHAASNYHFPTPSPIVTETVEKTESLT
ncbi:actin-related protein 5 isoform X2 [Hermetia illucens]|nr:actin-related protein 5 isoform X2 [Hermetia illucens]XP_037915293.1 actin-related protein 5 isoform X2 [Hermetia illucens]